MVSFKAGDAKDTYGARSNARGRMGAVPMTPKEDPATLVCEAVGKVQVGTDSMMA